MYNCSNSEFFFNYLEFISNYLQVIEVITFIEGPDLVYKPIRQFENCVITVVAKISTCNQRYKSTLQMAFDLQ